MFFLIISQQHHYMKLLEYIPHLSYGHEISCFNLFQVLMPMTLSLGARSWMLVWKTNHICAAVENSDQSVCPSSLASSKLGVLSWGELVVLSIPQQTLLCIVGDAANSQSLGNMDLDELSLFGNLLGPGPAVLDQNRLPSESSSCKSRLSSLTMDSEDGYRTSVSEDSSRGAFSRQTSTDDECFLSKDGDDILRNASSRRNRSISITSSGSLSPLWEGNYSSMFGTLPRKSRRGSVRKQILKFIPGLHRAVEEEESRF